MTEPSPKPAKHGRKRAEILNGALEHIAKHGLEATGLKEIAAHLGITHPALYYYFTSKNELVFEAVRVAMIGLLDDLQQSQVDLSSNAEVRLMALCEAHVQHELARGHEVSFVNAFIYGPLQNATDQPQANKDEIASLQRQVFELYRSIILDGQKAGVFVNTSSAVLAFGVLGVVSYAVSWFRAEGSLTINAAARTLAAQALRSVSVDVARE